MYLCLPAWIFHRLFEFVQDFELKSKQPEQNFCFLGSYVAQIVKSFEANLNF